MAIVSAVFQDNVFQDNAFQDNEFGTYAFQPNVFQKLVFDRRPQIVQLINESLSLADSERSVIGLIKLHAETLQSSESLLSYSDRYQFVNES